MQPLDLLTDELETRFDDVSGGEDGGEEDEEGLDGEGGDEGEAAGGAHVAG